VPWATALRGTVPEFEVCLLHCPRLRVGLMDAHTNPKRERGLLDRVELSDGLTALRGHALQDMLTQSGETVREFMLT
jgi:hypothetical protein